MQITKGKCLIKRAVQPTGREIRAQVQRALAEDVGTGDATTIASIPASVRAQARIVAREPLVVAGLAVAEAVFGALQGPIVC